MAMLLIESKPKLSLSIINTSISIQRLGDQMMMDEQSKVQVHSLQLLSSKVSRKVVTEKVLSTFGHLVMVDDDKIIAIVMVIPVQSIQFQSHQHPNINNHHGMLNVAQVQWPQLIHQALIKIKK